MAAALGRRLAERTARPLFRLQGYSTDAAALGTSTAWWGKGLNFKCTQCGKCCTGHRRAVYISEVEAEVCTPRLLGHGRLSRPISVC